MALLRDMLQAEGKVNTVHVELNELKPELDNFMLDIPGDTFFVLRTVWIT